jgi:DASS family divalent anion:Na+ symporter
MAVSVVLAMTTLALTRTLPSGQVLTGFSNSTVWLIFTAFLYARAVTVTGLGRRVAYLFIQRFGRSSLTLAYSMAGANLVVAPFVPSDTARGGGIIFPITRSLAQVFGSEPGPTASRLGSFLILSAFHANYTVSAMFLTSMAANALIAEFARKIAHVELTWGSWALAASLPGLITLALAPYVIYRLHPPEVRDTQAARAHAAEELAHMGPMSRQEIALSVIFVAVMGGWVTSPWHGINNTIVALAGISAILLCRVVTWDELLAEGRAWDALIWFGPLIMMADALNESGVIRILSSAIFQVMHGWSWPVAAIALTVAYVYIHYGFASLTAHVMALYPSFLAAGVAAGAPPLAMALVLAFLSSLNAAMTHYGTGSAPVFFGAGYVAQGTWWRLGLLISLMNLIIWLGIGPLWWKALGMW